MLQERIRKAVEGTEAAIDCVRLYVDVEADAIFPEALKTETEFRQFAEQIDAPL